MFTLLHDSLHVPFRQGSKSNREFYFNFRFLPCRSLQYTLTIKLIFNSQLYLCMSFLPRIFLLIPPFLYLSDVSQFLQFQTFLGDGVIGRRSIKKSSRTGQLVCIFLHYNNPVIHKRFITI